MQSHSFLSKKEKRMVLNAIQKAERETSGEIVLRLESKCEGSALKKAVELFDKLGMRSTSKRNGVLIFIATEDRKFAIFGDEGINSIVPNRFWSDVLEVMSEKFAAGNYSRGITSAIEMIGEKLKKYFPSDTNDVNELPDEISVGE